jgi:hypothetical protein
MSDQQQVAIRKGREGARWINERPTPEEFGAWFRENVKLHDGMDPERYVGGVVLIPAVDEKAKYVKGFNQQGAPIIDQRPELAYIPYGKVETRINYFWDLLELKADKWYGELEPITTPRPSVVPVDSNELIEDGGRVIQRDTSRVPITAQIVEQLPPGFFLMSVPVGNNLTHFLCCSYRCAIYSVENPERPLRQGRGTKMVPLVLGRQQFYADQNSIMKAETGAMGRALGTAGIFVIPGSGVATAEDMQEAITAQPTAQQQPEAATEDTSGPAAPTAAPVPQDRTAGESAADEHAALVQRARDLLTEAQNDYPDVLSAFRDWGAQREPPVRNLNELRGGALRGAVRTLERLVDEAKQNAAAREGEPEGSDGSPADSRGLAEPQQPSPVAPPVPEEAGGRSGLDVGGREGAPGGDT